MNYSPLPGSTARKKKGAGCYPRPLMIAVVRNKKSRKKKSSTTPEKIQPLGGKPAIPAN
jgi:hypothetical protein